MTNKNILMIAVAGSGKTTYLINKALEIKNEKVLVTTYTQSNEREIRKKFMEIKGYIPKNITIQTWFSFLLKHGVKPYQGSFITDKKVKRIKGILFMTEKSCKYSYVKDGEKKSVSYKKKDKKKYYFNKENKIYSDKLSEFMFECNKEVKNEVVDRLSRIYPYIFIDEVQDLAGYDLELIKVFFQSNSQILLVGDPRQTIYLTNHPKKNLKYENGKIKLFIEEKLKKNSCYIDEKTLNVSHRNNLEICNLSSELYRSFPISQPCSCCDKTKSEHVGIFRVHKSDIDQYLKKTNNIVQLRYNKNIEVNNYYKSYTFGTSKGLSFDHVLIYPTKAMEEWLDNHQFELKPRIKAKLYVGITRARYSVAFVTTNIQKSFEF